MSLSEFTPKQNFKTVAAMVYAFKFAADFHKLQRRKSDGSSYIVHPLGVANRLIGAGCKNLDMVIAAIFHDLIEDTDCTEKDIEEGFGKEVLGLVLEVTDDKSLDKITRKKGQVSHCVEISKKAQQIKLADKLDNLSDLVKDPPKGWSVERCQGYFVWAKTIVDKIGHANEELNEQLQKLFKGTFTREEFRQGFVEPGSMGHKAGECCFNETVTYPCIPKDISMEEALENYYKLLKESNEK